MAELILASNPADYGYSCNPEKTVFQLDNCGICLRAVICDNAVSADNNPWLEQVHTLNPDASAFIATVTIVCDGESLPDAKIVLVDNNEYFHPCPSNPEERGGPLSANKLHIQICKIINHHFASHKRCALDGIQEE